MSTLQNKKGLRKGRRNRGKKPKINRWEKAIPKEFVEKFTDTIQLQQAMKQTNPRATIILSTGALDPLNLTSDDHKKHGAFYVSMMEMPKEFFNKKFDGGKAKKTIKFFQDTQKFAEDKIGSHMQNGTTISVEFMGSQNRPFNKASPEFAKAAVVPHGSIVAHVPKELLDGNPKAGLDSLCEASIFEGYVVVNKKSGDRWKLKREYFSSANDPKKQRKEHDRAPSMEKGEYTSEGLRLCGGDGFGYFNVALNHLEDSKQEQAIVKLNIGDHVVDLVVRPISDVIKNQLQHPFKGQKMINLFVTSGKGDTYQYTDEPIVDGLFDNPLEFQMKLDGETALVHKDENGQIHLMIKFQVDVYEVENDDGSKNYRFGWI